MVIIGDKAPLMFSSSLKRNMYF